MPQLYFPLLLIIIFFSSTTLFLCISSASTVTHLPGFNGGALPFHLETGYVNVDEVTKADLFYYFVESERNPREDPLILWLTGGPGCSSFYAFVREIGPLRFIVAPYNGTLPTLVYNPYAWTKVSNIIFLDWPAVSGFSFLKTSRDYYNGDDFKSLKEICYFLEQWFLDHPKFKSNPFYVGGNSYGGKMVPIVALTIAEGIEAGEHAQINLKGYISGNPATSAVIDGNSRVSYSHGVGILSDELFEAILRSCPGEDYKNPMTGPCIEQIELFRGALNELMLDNFLTPKCEGESSWPVLSHTRETHRSMLEQKSTKLQTPPNVPDITCTTYASYLAYHWANDKNTRKALHVKEGTVKEWQVCRSDYDYDSLSIRSSIPYHHGVINRGYRALIMSGDHDMVIPYSGTLEWIKSLNLSTLEPWRSWLIDGQVGGYTVRHSKNLTFATVKGGGHEPAKDLNKETSALFRSVTWFLEDLILQIGGKSGDPQQSSARAAWCALSAGDCVRPTMRRRWVGAT